MLRENRVLLVRHALDAGVVGRYGAAFRANYGNLIEGVQAAGEAGKIARFRNEHFRRLHQEAGLAPYALVRSLAHSPAINTLMAYFETDKRATSWEHLLTMMVIGYRNGPQYALPYHQIGGTYAAVRAW